MAYRVTAPYITVKISGMSGVEVRGFNAGAVLPEGVLEESIEHHLRKKMIEPLAQPEPTPEPAAATENPRPSGGSADPDAPPAPGDTPVPPPESGPGSGKAAWVDHAERMGMDRAEAEAMSRDDLIKALKGN